MQHKYEIPNQAGAGFRADLNEALAAIASNNSGLTEPSQTFAYQWWADTTTGVLKQRNAGNTEWVPVFNMNLGHAFSAGFTAVPATYMGMEIVVTSPHLRKMVWNSAQKKYIRAPWHRAGDIHFAYANVTSWPGALPLRSDLVWNTADYPDLAALLGVVGPTFTLAEARARVLRALDNGLGIDAGRTWASLQEDAIRNITGEMYLRDGSARGIGRPEGYSGALTASTTTGTIANPSLGGTETGQRGITRFDASLVTPTASEIRVKSIAFNIFVDY